MQSPAIDQLFDEYRNASHTQLNSDQFGSLLIFFPSMLVVASDGQVDEDEWVFMKYLSKFIADTYKDEIADEDRNMLQEAYLKELEFLMSNLSVWEEKFISTLHDALRDNPEVKEDVLDVLHLFADASEGESDLEANKIEALRVRLDL